MPLKSLTAAASKVRAFGKAQDGTVAMITALSAIVLCGMTGLAIDCGRAFHAERKLTAAVDAAALAAAKAMRDGGLTDGEAREIATRYFNSNMAGGGSYAVVRTLDVRIDRAASSVTVDADAEVRMTFGQVAGFERISLPTGSTAIFDSKDIEVGLQLDVTGSMRGRKLADLKDAVAGANGLVDVLIPSTGTSNRVRIGLAPYASGVNAGPYASAVSGGRATNGCVYERRNLADQTTELAATGTHALKARADLSGRSIGDCPADAEVMALTNDRRALISEINGWSVSTSTAGHLGTAWAWYLVSPEWSSIWPSSARPAAYGDGRTMKVAILMTDGIYNTVGGVNGGDVSATADQSKRFAIDTCEAMKARGVIVYTVGFEVPRDVRPTLASCASDASKFYDAADGTALRLAFRAIASEINNLRISR